MWLLVNCPQHRLLAARAVLLHWLCLRLLQLLSACTILLLACPFRDHLLPCDFLLFFDGDTDTANEAFAYFDRNGDGSISCSELQESAAEMLCERKNIAASIKVGCWSVSHQSTVQAIRLKFGFLLLLLFLLPLVLLPTQHQD
jgi:hypothetical protein